MGRDSQEVSTGTEVGRPRDEPQQEAAATARPEGKTSVLELRTASTWHSQDANNPGSQRYWGWGLHLNRPRVDLLPDTLCPKRSRMITIYVVLVLQVISR